MSRVIILTAIQMVGAILAAFGGALTKAQPPDDGKASSASYIASFVAVILLLAITAIVKHFNKRIKAVGWAGVSLLLLVGFCATAIKYEQDKSVLTVGLPPTAPTEWHVIGTEKTPIGERIFANAAKQGITDSPTIVWGAKSALPNPIPQIWTSTAINHAVQKLTIEYVLVITLLSMAIFFAAESLGGMLPNGEANAPASSPRQSDGGEQVASQP